MSSLGFESKNPTIFNMIADLEGLGREVDFEEFLDGITSRLGDKESRVIVESFRQESIKFSISSTMTILAQSTPLTFAASPKNLEKP
jgi:hypothetical protein